MESAIYNIRNVLNNNIYIGSAINFKKRWSEHKNLLLNNKHYSIFLQNSWNKYGAENFEFENIEYVKDKTKLIEREQVWLDFFNPKYNTWKTATSPLGIKLSEATKRKMSMTRKGYKVSEETKLKIGIANKGKKRSNESKLKMSLTHKNMSDELRLKMSIAHKGKKLPDEVKRKIGDANRGRKLKKRSDEHKRKLSIAKKGKKHSGLFKKGQIPWNKGIKLISA